MTAVFDPNQVVDEHVIDEQAQQAAVEAYGLTRQAQTPADEKYFAGFAELAQRLSGADCAAINIMDGNYQTTLAASMRLPMKVSMRQLSICDWVLRNDAVDRDSIAIYPDLESHPILRDNQWVSGKLARLRSYAAMPLMTPEGDALGTICVFSLQDRPGFREGAMQLVQARDAVMQALESRRTMLTLNHVADERIAGFVRPLASPVDRSRAWPINAVIDDRAITTVFQPIVHLATGAVVGFEALSRGPKGTDLESPLALIEAAQEVGRLGELDWVCRTGALTAASKSDLHPSISWFVNVEPAGLQIECPERLRAEVAQAKTDLRVILEVVERDVEGNVVDLLHATDQAREDAWGVALDDVGAEEASLALLPFLYPDVVKLDMSLVRDVPQRSAATITAAVQSYAERNGAVILAEGIETVEQERLAKVLGATYGQGYLYGMPGDLPKQVPVPRYPIPLRQKPNALSDKTVFETVSECIEPRTASKDMLTHIAEYLETLGARHEYCVLLANFNDEADFQHERQELYRRLADQGSFTFIYAADAQPMSEPRYQVRPIPRSVPERGDWHIIFFGPQYAAAFVARHRGPGSGGEEYEYIYTHDRATVVEAARAFLARSHAMEQ